VANQRRNLTKAATKAKPDMECGDLGGLFKDTEKGGPSRAKNL